MKILFSSTLFAKKTQYVDAHEPCAPIPTLCTTIYQQQTEKQLPTTTILKKLNLVYIKYQTHTH